MPVYAFTCQTCGAFEIRRPAVDASRELACPTCHTPARRRFTPPGVSRMPGALRSAREREERSAYAREVVAAPSGRPHYRVPAG